MEGRVNPWFRLYHAVLDDPKVQLLPDKLFKAWVNLLCLASRNAGIVPAAADVAFALRISEGEAGKIIHALIAARLIDRDGETLLIHNWAKRQFQSDGTSAERSRRFRARHRDTLGNVPRDAIATPSATAPESEQSTTETPDADASGARRNTPGGHAHVIDLTDWEPGDADRRYAQSLGLDAERVLADLRAWAANVTHAKRRKRDAGAFWQSWCRRDADRAAGQGRRGFGQSGLRGSGAPGLLAAAAEVIAFDTLRDPPRE